MNQKTKQEKIDRLAKAREARYKKNPPAYKQFAASVVAKPDDDEFSLKNVREWIKEAKSFLPKFHSQLMKVVKTGVISKKTASRKISKITKKINKSEKK